MSSKTKLFENELRFLYLDRGMTDREISEKLSCTKQAVYKARKKFSINAISVIERNQVLIKVSKRQEDILRGSLMGDAYLGPSGEFDIQHGHKQFGYLLWLFKNLQPYFGEIRNTRTCRRIRSCAHPFGLQIRAEYYAGGKKTINRDILDKLNELSLAVWFMDDGQVFPSGKQARLSTHCFSEEEHEIMVKYFSERWGLDAKIGKAGEYKQLLFNKENMNKLVGLIRPHVPVAMRYKIRPATGFSMYLSGGMEFKKKLGSGWRDWITKRLAEQNISCLDPVKLEPEAPGNVPLQTLLSDLKKTPTEGNMKIIRDTARNSFFRKDVHAIQLSDAIIVLYDRSAQLGAGTLSEAWEAFREGRPVYLMSDFPLESIPVWLVGETSEIFYSFEDLLEYTKDPNNILRDIKEAQKVRDTVIGDLY
ncbi:hypothetical protein LCGC14_0487770 [marine sediment metagenome]|uniref:Homing endonuclease LAGLIDADG domain-containing protein n=1 Tax=marine sediment metagenome TaxID=412755 RepID=A0A0F9SQS8_9ZZZZ